MGRFRTCNRLFWHGSNKKTNEQIFAKAQEWIDWVNDEPKQANTSNTAKAMHDFAKNPTGIMKPTDHNNNDLPDLPF